MGLTYLSLRLVQPDFPSKGGLNIDTFRKVKAEACLHCSTFFAVLAESGLQVSVFSPTANSGPSEKPNYSKMIRAESCSKL